MVEAPLALVFVATVWRLRAEFLVYLALMAVAMATVLAARLPWTGAATAESTLWVVSTASGISIVMVIAAAILGLVRHPESSLKWYRQGLLIVPLFSASLAALASGYLAAWYGATWHTVWALGAWWAVLLVSSVGLKLPDLFGFSSVGAALAAVAVFAVLGGDQAGGYWGRYPPLLLGIALGAALLSALLRFVLAKQAHGRVRPGAVPGGCRHCGGGPGGRTAEHDADLRGHRPAGRGDGPPAGPPPPGPRLGELPGGDPGDGRRGAAGAPAAGGRSDPVAPPVHPGHGLGRRGVADRGPGGSRGPAADRLGPDRPAAEPAVHDPGHGHHAGPGRVPGLLAVDGLRPDPGQGQPRRDGRRPGPTGAGVGPGRVAGGAPGLDALDVAGAAHGADVPLLLFRHLDGAVPGPVRPHRRLVFISDLRGGRIRRRRTWWFTCTSRSSWPFCRGSSRCTATRGGPRRRSSRWR